MLNQLIENLVDQCDGAEAGFVMTFDGMAVEIHAQEAERATRAAGMEFAFVMTQVRKAAAILEVGALEEVIICSNKFTFLLRVLDEAHFSGLVLGPKGNLGKGRFLLRMAAADLSKAL